MKAPSTIWLGCVAVWFVLLPALAAVAQPAELSADSAGISGAVSNSSGTAGDPSPNPQTAERHGVGIGFKFGTLGIGGEAAVALNQHLNLRGGVNFFRITRTTTQNGITYSAGIHLGNVPVYLDWFPKAGSFHVSPGVLVYNGNNVNGSANVSGGQSFTLNNFTYYSSTTTPVTGTASFNVNKAAPLVTVGWGNLVPRTKHWDVSFEGGVVFWGTPSVGLNLTGDVCDANQNNCRSITSDPLVQLNLRRQIAKYNSDVSPYKVYPILSFGVGYKF